MSDKLSDCPFCGGTPSLDVRDVEPQGDPWYGENEQMFVLCGCGACLFDGAFHEGFGNNRESAIAAWNRRASPAPAIPAEKPRPTAWVRFRSDGGFEGPIMDSDARMCDTRRTSGAWAPLYMDAPAIPAVDAVAIRDAALEAAAAAVEDHQRAGREWVNSSLWGSLSREAATRIRALKAAPAISESEWQPIETAPRDGTRILTFNVTPTYDEDERRMVDIEAISVAYWLFGAWMEYPASPRFVQGQEHMFWKPLPASPIDAARKGEKS
ncbi:hypothetical protein BGLA2_1720044 [Burkholderia gladioli]|uniref:Lar family restriction alleviation protein n=1 Tax=Burkholderia gladioli TaxID=28095 RepID=UPI001CB48B40|nr:Lar family restriction alleviation protein [Burkholderia gladioli]CAG9205411.1 hypothetical protein BGLA2_1720044 [Burkholderia gladioli]